MKIKIFFAFVLALVLAFILCACGSEIADPEEPSSEPEIPVEESSEPEISQEPETEPEPEKTPEEIAKACGYMSFEEITVAGYYPDWMQPHTIIIYDENGNPEIIEGGELLPEDRPFRRCRRRCRRSGRKRRSRG